VDKTYYVYHLKDPADNYPFYIGKGLGRRICEHVRMAKRGSATVNIHKRNKILKVLREGREVEQRIIFRTDSEGEALNKEVKEISEWREKIGVKLTNLTTGGESPELSEETRRKLSASCKRSARENPNLGRRGQKMPEGWINPLKGKTRPLEVGQNISKAKKGKPCPTKGIKRSPLSKEHKEKLRIAHKGKKHTEEQRKNHLRAIGERDQGGARNPFYNKSHSEENKQRIREARLAYWESDKGKKRKEEMRRKEGEEGRPTSKLGELDIPVIRRLYNDTELSMKQIGNMFEVSRTTIRNVINGRTWRYVA